MGSGEELNLDTSVLLNYAESNIPSISTEDKGSQRLLEGSSFHCVIGQKAEEELEACCERRFEMYEDFLQWVNENPNKSIYKYDPAKRDISSRNNRNDINHLRFDIQSGLSDKHLHQTLSSIRRCRQDLLNMKRILLENLISEIYGDISKNNVLIDELRERDLGLDHDKDIISDAVEICKKDAINILVSLDSDIRGFQEADIPD